MTTVVLVRHGETDWNRERRVQGWAPTPLNERGREQAWAVGRHLAAAYAVDRLVASDLRRCQETAERIHAAGLPEPVFDAAWRERHFGVYQGLTYEAVFDRHPELDLAETGIVALRTTPEGGESVLDLRERVLAGWDALLAAAADDGTVAVVTHGGPLYVVLGHVKGIDAITAITEHVQSNCAINEVRYDPGTGEAAVVCENDTGYSSR